MRAPVVRAAPGVYSGDFIYARFFVAIDVTCNTQFAMYNDDFEHGIAASMDSLDNLESIDAITYPPPASTPITTAKLAKFKRLPEIDENTSTADLPSSSADILYRVSSDALAACISGDLRKTVLINNSANEMLSNSLLNTSDESLDEPAGGAAPDEASAAPASGAEPDKAEQAVDDTVVPATGTRRKFIVTRMDSNVLLETQPRPEADHLKHLSARTNYATISFPCSSSVNRSPLGNLFGTNQSFEPHLDKRFFDTSLVRINTNSTQSSNVSAASSQDAALNVDGDIWERRKEQHGGGDDGGAKPPAVSFQPCRDNVSVAIGRVWCILWTGKGGFSRAFFDNVMWLFMSSCVVFINYEQFHDFSMFMNACNFGNLGIFQAFSAIFHQYLLSIAVESQLFWIIFT